ncbi:SAM-dependent methyltransferase [Mycobacterium sp. 21AC1]|uniref:SAM-dependent methyltransferase n=1 Tax=[Mycobacterium] appelbergii TaxID=2939269 RepID=UPI0029390612|nr:SAM-dependent methyltransferase [Mycobacterium sp. 21AC1]MDV3129127.1 SAM-dependent methyltransferase [Mycobacterium sp. 21AC1]
MNAPAAQTAIGPMVIVAADQYEQSPLIHDPWARRMLPLTGRLAASSTRWSVMRRLLISATEKKFDGGWASFLCRKRYIDDQLRAAHPGGIEAVVILGAGFDTRAYRMPELAGVRVCEVDLSTNIAAKTKALRRCFGAVPSHVTLLPVDFEANDLTRRLDDAGFNRTQPVFYIWEAVTQYLTDDAVRSTMDHLAGAAPGSSLAFTFVRQDFLDGEHLYGARAAYDEFVVNKRLWKFGLHPDQVPEFLAGYGWHQREQVGAQEYSERYLRPAGRSMNASPIERAVYAQR